MDEFLMCVLVRNSK